MTSLPSAPLAGRWVRLDRLGEADLDEMYPILAGPAVYAHDYVMHHRPDSVPDARELARSVFLAEQGDRWPGRAGRPGAHRPGRRHPPTRVSERCPVSAMDTSAGETQARPASAVWVIPRRSRSVRSRTPASSRAGPGISSLGRLWAGPQRIAQLPELAGHDDVRLGVAARAPLRDVPELRGPGEPLGPDVVPGVSAGQLDQLRRALGNPECFYLGSEGFYFPS